jgi:hypothetical protein
MSLQHIEGACPSDKQNVDRNRLARIRRWAKRRGHRVLKDWTKQYSLVDANVEPPRALAGLEHASLEDIEVAVTTPLPPPRPSHKRPPMARLEGNGSPQPSQASHPPARSFEVLIDLLNRSAT